MPKNYSSLNVNPACILPTHPNRDPERQQRSLKNLSILHDAILQKNRVRAQSIIDLEVQDAQDEILRLINLDTGVQ